MLLVPSPPAVVHESAIGAGGAVVDELNLRCGVLDGLLLGGFPLGGRSGVLGEHVIQAVGIRPRIEGVLDSAHLRGRAAVAIAVRRNHGVGGEPQRGAA